MSDGLKDFNSANFESEIQTGITIVDFWATWCGPCRMQTPVLVKLAAKMGNTVKIGKVNVDEEQELAANFGIQSIPTLLIFKDGQIVQKLVGLQNESSLVSAVQNA